MLLNLIKKDFLIIKKYVFLMLLITILIPPFLLLRIPEFASSASFLIATLYSVFMLLQYVFLKEYQYPKAAALLCATPYPRSAFVKSKYGFYLLIYLACSVVYWIETYILPDLGKFSIEMALVMFFGISMFVSVFFPIQFKLGYEKTRFVFFIVIMAAPFLLPKLVKFNGNLFFYRALSIPNLLIDGAILLGSFIILAISTHISVKIYSHKDLA